METTLYYIMTNAGAQIISHRGNEIRVFWVDNLSEYDSSIADIYKRDENGEIIGYGKDSYDEQKAKNILNGIEDDSSAELLETDDIDDVLGRNDTYGDPVYIIACVTRNDL